MSSKLILASSSQYRKELLKQLAIPFACQNPNIDETPQQNEPPAELSKRLSLSKALAIYSQNPGSIVIGSDQVADLNGTLLGKPHTMEQAIQQLTDCSGQEVSFYTGIALAHPNGFEVSTIATHVKFRQLTQNQIRTYLEKEQPLNCAGSFKCEGLGIALFEYIRSEDPSSLIGLPLISLVSFLNKIGFEVLT